MTNQFVEGTVYESVFGPMKFERPAQIHGLDYLVFKHEDGATYEILPVNVPRYFPART